MCVPWLVHACVVNYSYAWHVLFVCATLMDWYIYVARSIPYDCLIIWWASGVIWLMRTLQHTATHCSTLQQCCSVLQWIIQPWLNMIQLYCEFLWRLNWRQLSATNPSLDRLFCWQLLRLIRHKHTYRRVRGITQHLTFQQDLFMIGVSRTRSFLVIGFRSHKNPLDWFVPPTPNSVIFWITKNEPGSIQWFPVDRFDSVDIPAPWIPGSLAYGLQRSFYTNVFMSDQH